MPELQDLMPQSAYDTMRRINENHSVIGTVIVNEEGFPELTNMDSMTAVKCSTSARMLGKECSEAIRCLDPTNEVTVVRVVSKKTEAIIIPDEGFHLVAVIKKY